MGEPRVVAADPEDGVPDAGGVTARWRGTESSYSSAVPTRSTVSTTLGCWTSDEPERGPSPRGWWRRGRNWSSGTTCVRPLARGPDGVPRRGVAVRLRRVPHQRRVQRPVDPGPVPAGKPKWERAARLGNAPHPGWDTPRSCSAIASSSRAVAGHPPWARAGTYATADQGLATMQGLTFFEGGFAMLDVSRRRWMPIQHPIRGATCTCGARSWRMPGASRMPPRRGRGVGASHGARHGAR